MFYSVVQLVQNFRSHSGILKFPNEHFYRNSLLVRGNPSITDRYIGSSVLVNPKFPVVCHALPGKDDREASSPSFFNVLEVLEVKRYVQKLRSDRLIRICKLSLLYSYLMLLTSSVADQDIGVITPYHAQCLRIRATLRSVADGIKVGSVEEFQGQVRPPVFCNSCSYAKVPL